MIWQRAAMFRPAACFSAWLFGIAWNKAMKARIQWHQYTPEAPSTREAGSNQDNPEQRCGQWEQHRIVARPWRACLPSSARSWS